MTRTPLCAIQFRCLLLVNMWGDALDLLAEFVVFTYWLFTYCLVGFCFLPSHVADCGMGVIAFFVGLCLFTGVDPCIDCCGRFKIYPVLPLWCALAVRAATYTAVVYTRALSR
jgi:hypothetical protein